MREVLLTAAAYRDFHSAYEYLEAHSENTAVLWEAGMYQEFDFIAQWPQASPVRTEFAPDPLRVHVHGDYLIIYNPTTDPILVIAILHAARNTASLIADRLP